VAVATRRRLFFTLLLQNTGTNKKQNSRLAVYIFALKDYIFTGDGVLAHAQIPPNYRFTRYKCNAK